MKLGALKTHALWALGLVGAFFLGTQLENQEESRSSQSTSSDSVSPRSSRQLSSQDRGGQPNSERQKASQNNISNLFSDSPFSGDRIEQLVKASFSDPNQINRRLAFSKLLEGMTRENASAIRDQLSAFDTDSTEWRDFHYAWGALAGAEAFTDSIGAEKKDLRSLMSGWAAVDPSGAIAMIADLPEELADQKERLESGIVSGLADRDRDEAANYVFTLAAEGRENTGNLMERVTHEVIRASGHEDASVWVAGLDDGPLKGSAMNEVAERYVRNDPEAASQWIETFASEDYAARAVREIGKEWAEKEPLAAVTWLDQLPEGEGQNRGLNSAFGDWEDKDPVAAGEYLMNMPTSAKRDSAISGFAIGYAYQDPQTAIAWANDISDPALRMRSLTSVASAFYRRSPEEARAWLPDSGLSPEAQAQVQSRRRR